MGRGELAVTSARVRARHGFILRRMELSQRRHSGDNPAHGATAKAAMWSGQSCAGSGRAALEPRPKSAQHACPLPAAI
jgi:hypothetical protein